MHDITVDEWLDLTPQHEDYVHYAKVHGCGYARWAIEFFRRGSLFQTTYEKQRPLAVVYTSKGRGRLVHASTLGLLHVVYPKDICDTLSGYEAYTQVLVKLPKVICKVSDVTSWSDRWVKINRLLIVYFKPTGVYHA